MTLTNGHRAREPSVDRSTEAIRSLRTVNKKNPLP